MDVSTTPQTIHIIQLIRWVGRAISLVIETFAKGNECQPRIPLDVISYHFFTGKNRIVMRNLLRIFLQKVVSLGACRKKKGWIRSASVAQTSPETRSHHIMLHCNLYTGAEGEYCDPIFTDRVRDIRCRVYTVSAVRGNFMKQKK